MAAETNRDLLADPDVRRAFEEELLFGEVTDTVSGLVDAAGVSQRELARRLGVSEARISQILSGSENLTLRSVAALGWALGVRIGVSPSQMQNRAGTPAESDPPAPVWLNALKPQPEIVFRTVPSPKRRTSPQRRHLRVVDPGRGLAA